MGLELSDNCIKSLCGLTIAGGAVAVGLGGIALAAGTVELLTNAGNLALSVNAGQDKELAKIEKAVTKSITKNYKSWLAADHGDDWAKKSDVTAALEQLGDAIVISRPQMQDMIEAKLNATSFVNRLLARLPENSLFRTSDIAKQVFSRFLINTHSLWRTNKELKPLFDSFSFEAVFSQFDAAQADRDAKHNELMKEIAREKGFAPKDLAYLFEKVGEEAPEGNFEAEVRKAVDKLLALGGKPVERLNDGAAINTILQNARDHLLKGEAEEAIESLKSGRGEQKQLRLSQQRGEARLAFEEAKIHQAIYAREEAIAAFQDGLELEPENLWARLELAHELVLFGDTLAAKAEANKGLDFSSGNSRERSLFHNKLGDVQIRLGELEKAQGSYEAGMLIREGLSQSEPSNSEWQRDLSVSHNKLGDVQVSLGKLEKAQGSYEAGMLICEGLSQSDPLNSVWQRDLSVSHNRLGDVQVRLGELEKAQGSYEAGMLICEGLSQSDPSNSEWQRDLSVSHDRLGDVQVRLGELEKAQGSYEAGMLICEGLSQSDPLNSVWQRDLSVSHNRLGDVQVRLGELEKAQGSYEAGMLICEGLSQSDPSNSEWQRDLIIFHLKLSEVGAEPVENLRKALAIADALKSAEKLAPADDFMVEDLKNRLAALD